MTNGCALTVDTLSKNIKKNITHVFEVSLVLFGVLKQLRSVVKISENSIPNYKRLRHPLLYFHILKPL